MSLVEDLLAKQMPRGPECSVGLFLRTLPAGLDRSEVEAAALNPAIHYTTLASWARAHAGPGQDAWSRHRRGECACDRAG